MTDFELNLIIRELGRKLKREVVAKLLQGNNTQCFTTEQYLQKYIEHVQDGDKGVMDLKLARQHLMSGTNIREVKPDVWTLKERQRGK